MIIVAVYSIVAITSMHGIRTRTTVYGVVTGATYDTVISVIAVYVDTITAVRRAQYEVVVIGTVNSDPASVISVVD